MKTGTLDVGSVAFVHGESLGGGLPCRSQALEAENDSTFFGRASSRLASDYQRQMYHMRFTQSTPSSPIRSVSSRAKISNTNNNIEESGSPASPSRRRLASATRRLGGATAAATCGQRPVQALQVDCEVQWSQDLQLQVTARECTGCLAIRLERLVCSCWQVETDARSLTSFTQASAVGSPPTIWVQATAN
eukprot:CAMPEP_0173127586 /NCGR_PEP_ID=MMETSP1102-20130122/57908_1 /TAXON_ID=49646 /ORGANISM="Geminigera sp., Strain Caron Lab Isolate" /LENGTH=190 /DNA_ID=CAMNT_0014037289 /DNA_START=156 /DNA_END=725 /DNA_ORIENTATION=+